MKSLCMFATATFLALASPAHAAWPQGSTINLAVCSNAGGQSVPLAISDGAGGEIVAWSDYRQGGGVIYAQRIRANGTPAWTADGVPLCGIVTFANQPPVLVSDGAGGAIVAWQDYRTLTPYNVYAQRVDSTGVLQWNADGVAICTSAVAFRAQQFLSIASDGAHGAVISWSDDRAGLRNDVYVQRVNGAGAVLWTANGIGVCTLGTFKLNSYVAPDGTGGVFVVWSDGRPPLSTYEAWVQRIDGTGLARFAVDGLRACPALFGQHAAGVVADADAGAIVVISGPRDSDTDGVGAQRVNSIGNFYWGTSGRTLVAAPGAQGLPRAIPDGHGGVIAGWEDTRNGGVDIYAQRSDSMGTMLWGSSGVAVCASASDQSGVTVASDSAGGAVFAWDDPRIDVNGDIYAQRVSAAGSPLWTGDGVALCTLVTSQGSTSIVADGLGGALVAWEDKRNSNIDNIYTQWIDGSGGLGGPTTGVGGALAPLAVSFAPPSPNPSRGSAVARYELASPGRVRLSLLDAAGRLVRVLAEGDQASGLHQSGIDLRDDAGRALAAGLYFVRLETQGGSVTRRLVALH